MATGGFTFGQTGGTGTTTGTVLGGGTGSGFSFGAPKTTPASGGFSLGGAVPTSASSTGFGFGTATQPANPAVGTGLTFGGLGGTPASTTTPSAGFTLGGLGATSAAPSTGFSLSGLGSATTKTASSTTGFSLGGLGGTTATTASTGFSLGGTSTAPSTGFSLGGTSTAPSTGFGLGGISTAPSTGFGLGGTSTAPSTGFSLAGKSTVPSTGFSLAGTTTAPSTGFSLAGTATAPSTGFSLAGTATAPSTGFSLAGTPAIKTSGLSLGGLLSNPTTLTTAAVGLGAASGNIFSTGNTTTGSASKGLGGVDPKTSAATAGVSSTNGKSSDTKAIKETPMPDLLVQTVEDFKKHIKDQKSVREDIARMSSKSMYKVQEDVTSLKQLLSVVSNGLQRNAAVIEKLKWEAARELKNAEMAHRTKDIPPGLQYENTAPTEYFHRLVEDFEMRMQTYRQQIETMESHLACLHQPNKMSPQELVMLLRKIHETFLALAAQLHQVHEAVKTQKDHYLNYRKVFHADDKNVFEKTKKPIVLPRRVTQGEIGGPNPFTSISSAAAVAMASAINRGQESSGAPPAVGLTGGHTSSLSGGLFGAAGSSSTGLGLGLQNTSLFNTSSNTATVKPLGGGGLFGNLSSNTSGLGLSATSAPTGIATPMPGGAPAPSLGGAPVENKMFFLAKPPVKRGKR